MTFVFFLICWIIIAFFTVGFWVLLSNCDETGIIFLIPIVIFGLTSIYPVKNTIEIPINNPEIVYNSTGAIITYKGQNTNIKDYAKVAGLKDGTLKPVYQIDHNFYDYKINDRIAVKSAN